MVRRLPVLQSNDDAAARRPRWHYFLIGCGFAVTLWLPLAMLALWLGPLLAGWGSNRDAQALPSPERAGLVALPLLVSFFLACFGAGSLVGRFGDAAGRREAIGGNLLGSAVLLLLAALGSQLSASLALAAVVFLVPCSVLGGWGGHALGKKLRPKGIS